MCTRAVQITSIPPRQSDQHPLDIRFPDTSLRASVGTAQSSPLSASILSGKPSACLVPSSVRSFSFAPTALRFLVLHTVLQVAGYTMCSLECFWVIYIYIQSPVLFYFFWFYLCSSAHLLIYLIPNLAFCVRGSSRQCFCNCLYACFDLPLFPSPACLTFL